MFLVVIEFAFFWMFSEQKNDLCNGIVLRNSTKADKASISKSSGAAGNVGFVLRGGERVKMFFPSIESKSPRKPYSMPPGVPHRDEQITMPKVNQECDQETYLEKEMKSFLLNNRIDDKFKAAYNRNHLEWGFKDVEFLTRVSSPNEQKDQKQGRRLVEFGELSAATSGKLFSGEKIRTFGKQHELMRVNSTFASEMLLSRSKQSCKNWGVVTTIFSASDAVKLIAKKKEWCLVVVADKKTPTEIEFNVPGCHFLTPEMQVEMFPDFSDSTPWNHFGRKNIGYLYAIKMDAERIWDFDDDNLGMLDLEKVFEDGVVAPCSQEFVAPPINPYPFYGVRNVSTTWPRGFPLDKIQDKRTTPDLCLTNLKDSDVFVYQSLANKEPDVDAIYRLTKETPFDFMDTEKRSLAIPLNWYTPFNAQATMWNRVGFYLLMLPASVHGRVADIWRGYIAEYMMAHTARKLLVFTKPYVVQKRNAHNYLGDFQSEIPLYLKASRFIDFLSKRPFNEEESFLQNLVDLYVDLYERDYIDESDVLLVAKWVKLLDPSIQLRFPFGLSIVVASRNDEYGGDSTERLARALQQISHFPWTIHVEYIIVEWNVPETGMTSLYYDPLIQKALNSVNRTPNVVVKFIEVPSRYGRLPNLPGYDCAMFEYWAKNVGLRRGQGEWKLITNIDDIFPGALLTLINTNIRDNTFDVKGFYTCARGDFQRSDVEGRGYNEMFHVNKDCKIHKQAASTSQCRLTVSNGDIGYVGDFEMLHDSVLRNGYAGGFMEIATSFGMDSEFLFRSVYLNGCKGYVIQGCPYCHQNHTKIRKVK